MSKSSEVARSGLHSINCQDNPELKSSACIIPDLLYFISLSSSNPRRTATAHFFSIDAILLYEPFFGDFGPLNLGCLYRFCETMNVKLKAAQERGKVVYYYCGSRLQYRSNAAVLIGGYSVLYLNMSPAQAYEPLRIYEPYKPFRDAAVGPCWFALLPDMCIRAIHLARNNNFFDFNSTFDPEAYEFFECVENGDLSVMIHNKFLAFAGPHSTRRSPDGYPTFTPEDYVPIFKKYKIDTVVRLNRKLYKKNRFTDHGFHHVDQYFIDGTCPNAKILNDFLDLCNNSGNIAIHCKAGLGRTGTLMSCYIMKQWEMPAAETIAWLRICRPGSVIGPQQNFVFANQAAMFERGRIERGGADPVPMGQPVPGRREDAKVNLRISTRKESTKKSSSRDPGSPTKKKSPSSPSKRGPSSPGKSRSKISSSPKKYSSKR